MKPTLAFVTQHFEQYNAQIFKGLLPRIPIRMSNVKTYLGNLRYKRHRTWLGTTKISDVVMRINTRYDLSEEEIQDVIIHEMIHLYILVSHQRDTAQHGPLFRQLMRDINRQHHRHITISYRAPQSIANGR